MSTIIAKNAQIGTSGTASNNFTLYQPSSPDGTVRLGNGNSGSVTDVASFTSAGVFAFNSGYGSVANAYGCRAWVNFNGTSTVAIRASANVTSITDNGTGDYTVNFTTAMPDANYSAVAVAGDGAVGAGSFNRCGNVGSYLTTSCRAFTGLPASSTAVDVSYINFAIFR